MGATRSRSSPYNHRSSRARYRRFLAIAQEVRERLEHRLPRPCRLPVRERHAAAHVRRGTRIRSTPFVAGSAPARSRSYRRASAFVSSSFCRATASAVSTNAWACPSVASRRNATS